MHLEQFERLKKKTIEKIDDGLSDPEKREERKTAGTAAD